MFRKILAAVASLILVTGCADASVHVGGRGPGHLVKSTNGSFVGTPGVALGVSYDTSIGLSVDSNGRADLTPRAGAQVFYVNSTTGSDSNTCTQAKSAATPKASIKSAVSCVVDGEGDHVLVAQGMSYPLGLAYIGGKGGFSAAYPFVIQSYDPADPTNQAKWGTADGSNRPDINITGIDSTSGGFLQGVGPAFKYHALRGLRFNGQNGDSSGMNAFNSSGGTPDDLLFENDDFDTTQISVASNVSVGNIQHVIFRNDSFHDAWGAGGRGQGIYASMVSFFTVEDSAFVHAGWKAGLTRADSPTIGGPSAQAHPLYEQDDVRSSIIRRNVFTDGSSDSGVLKGGGIYQNNLSIANPISASFGDGNLSSVYAPLGIYGEASFNAFIGNGWGIETVNIKQGSGSSFHHNALAHGDTSFSYANYALMADDKPDLSAPGSNYNISLPTYPIFDHNVAYLWGASQVIHLNSTPGLIGDIHATYTNNLWDDATSGSNTNNSGATFSNAYTATSIVQALGYADLATAQAAWKLNPQLHGWRAGPGLFLAGYGVVDPGLVDLKTNMALTAGYAPSYVAIGQFIGAHDGSTFSVSGLPAGVTFDSSSRSWTYDGSNTTISSGTFTITETNGAANHTTTIPWSISARPVLSGLSVAAGNGQVTINVSSNTANGKLFAEAVTSSTAPTPWDIRAGLDATDSSGATLWPHTSQAVTATGAQTPIVLTGLTNGTTYYAQVAQVDSGNNPSLTSTSISFTPAATWSPASLGSNLVAWYEAGDLTTLYQDTGCSTTPVTTDLQTVKCIKDKSGNGFNASNSTGWVYHANAGKPYLAMDGAHGFGTASATFADANGLWSAWFVGQVAVAADILGIGHNRAIRFTPGGAATNYVRDSGGTLLAQDDDASSVPAANTNTVLARIMTGTSGSGTVESLINDIGDGSTAWSGTPVTSGGFIINDATTGAGRLYVMVVAKGDQTANRTAMQTYLAPLHD